MRVKWESEIDKIKEELSNYRTFLTLSVLILIALASGLSKLYLSSNTNNPLFWLGLIVLEYFGIISITLIIKLKKKIKEIKE